MYIFGDLHTCILQVFKLQINLLSSWDESEVLLNWSHRLRPEDTWSTSILGTSVQRVVRVCLQRKLISCCLLFCGCQHNCHKTGRRCGLVAFASHDFLFGWPVSFSDGRVGEAKASWRQTFPKSVVISASWCWTLGYRASLSSLSCAPCKFNHLNLLRSQQRTINAIEFIVRLFTAKHACSHSNQLDRDGPRLAALSDEIHVAAPPMKHNAISLSSIHGWCQRPPIGSCLFSNCAVHLCRVWGFHYQQLTTGPPRVDK